MKIQIIKVALAALMLIAPSIPASAEANPDIKELLKGAAQNLGKGKQNGNNDTSSKASTGLSGLKGLVEGLISKSNLTEADLVGSYVYSDPAVAFRSQDLLKKAGGAAAAGVIVEKIRPYYQKAGIDGMTATFNNDSTFTFKLRRVTLTGTYTKDPTSENGDFIFQFKAGKKLPLGKFQTHVEKVGSKLTITFDASKLITLVNTIATATGQSTLQTAAKVLNSYDGLACGFELTPDNSASGATASK